MEHLKRRERSARGSFLGLEKKKPVGMNEGLSWKAELFEQALRIIR